MKFAASIPGFLFSRWVGPVLWVVFMIFFAGSEHNYLPHGIHSWAQSDRLALAYGFEENSLNFTDPRTLSMDSDNGRVGVEFPLVPYITAALVTSNQEYLAIPNYFRWINLVVLMLGLIIFVYSLTPHKPSWILLWFLSLSPSLLFYSFNFLPDTTSLAFTLAGIGFAMRWYRNPRHLTMFFALIFLALATLSKATAGIYFLSVAGSFVIPSLLKRNWKNIVIPLGITLILGLIVFLYDYYQVSERNKELWSVIFMSSPNQVKNWADVQNIWKGMRNWFPEYAHPILQILTASGLLLWIRSAAKRRLSTHVRTLSALFLVGGLGIYFLFGKQFINHDYYFISAFFPIVAIVVAFLWKRGSEYLPAVFRPNWLWLVLIVIGASQTFDQAKARGEDHYEAKHRVFDNDLSWMRKGKQVMDSLDPMHEARIFVLYRGAPNTSLIYFDRKGLTFNHEEMSRKGNNFNYWENRVQPNFYIIQDIWLDKLKRDKPQVYHSMHVVYSDPEYRIFVREPLE